MGSALVLVQDLVLAQVLVHDQAVDTVALVVFLVDEDSPFLVVDLFLDSMSLAFVAVLYLYGWRSLLLHARSPILAW